MNENSISHSLSITSYAPPTINMPMIMCCLDTVEKQRFVLYALEMTNKIEDHRDIREKAIASKKYDEKALSALYAKFQKGLEYKILEFVVKWYDEGDERLKRYKGLMTFLKVALGHYIDNTFQSIRLVDLAGLIATNHFTGI